MGQSASLRVRDFRAILQLVGDCRDLGDDCTVWRRHFTEGICRLVGADAGIHGELAGCRSLQSIDMGVTFWWPEGFAPPPYWGEHLERFRNDNGYSPVMSRYHGINREQVGLALSRKDFIADRDWYGGHDFLKIQEPLGFDHSLWCVRPLPGVAADENNGLVLFRELHRRDFSPRDRTIIVEAQSLLAPLIAGPLARFVEPIPSTLPPRTRQVLVCVLEGDGDKQVARRLGLSPYTVNQHTKLIFRHFAVQSRAELLARWIRRGWGGRFAWSEGDRPRVK